MLLIGSDYAKLLSMLDLKLLHVVFPKAQPVTISFNTWTVRDTYLVILENGKMQGIGGANPFKPITGDSPEELISDAKKIVKIPLDPSKDPISSLNDFLNKNIQSQSLASAIDSAYHDMLGKIKNVPVSKLYSNTIRYVDNSVTVFLKDTLQETATEAKKIFTAFPDLKILKIKLKGFDDVERVEAIKKVSPKGMKFTLDANQAYKDPKYAVEVLTAIGKVLGDVILVEEPCAKNDLEKMKFVKDNLSGMMVFADESLASLKDVINIAKANCAHGVNIKLQKVGGIYPAVEIAEFCRQNGLKFMVGAMIEDNIGLTAAAHFAASQPDAILTDLDTDIDLPRYVDGGSNLENGQRHIIESRKGLGINFTMHDLDSLHSSGELNYDLEQL
ncbi:MAG: enolase C-terminal domain-like protein [bacterium]